jgi:transposase-like protein
MKAAKMIEGSKCPRCGSTDKQVKAGFQSDGSQRCLCKECNYKYDLSPKGKGYSDEVKTEAIKAYYSGLSGRGVGKLMGFSKANVYNWLKKTECSVDKSKDKNRYV